MLNIFNFIDLYNDNVLVLSLSALSMTFLCLLFLWIYNKRKFANLTHHIPASVMKAYLDSVIQNSYALRSNLLRDEDHTLPLNLQFESMPLPSRGSQAPALAPGSSSLAQAATQMNGEQQSELLASKNAMIASLQQQVSEKNSMVSDLEEKITHTLASLRALEKEHGLQQEKLSALEQHAGGASISDDGLKLQLEEISKERDLLKERLQEYEFIANDLAEIPRLHRTVEALKNSLKELGVDPDQTLGGTGAPVDASSNEGLAPVESLDQARQEKQQEQQAIAQAESNTTQTAEGASTEQPSGKKEDDDLLMQFEKMLG